jgi:flavin-dependent dehydrogenase
MPDRFVGDGIVAVGDAAGQATLVVGEGIRMSITAGELAGEAIVGALAQGRADSDALKPYETRFRNEFARALKVGHLLNRKLSAYDDRHWDDGLRLLQGMPPRLIIQLLQADVRPREVATWLLRHPRHLQRAGVLLRAATTR